MQKLDLVGANLVKILKELIKDQKLCKLVYYNSYSPLSEPDLILPQNDLVNKKDGKIFPFPFDLQTTNTQNCEIRVYYPNIDFTSNEVIVSEEIFFDIVCHNNLWLISDGQVRPYEVMNQIFNIFSKKSIDTIGVLHFTNARHFYLNTSYNAIRLSANMMTL